MKLWRLEAVVGSNPWKPWYDKAYGFVVRAESETKAREIASKECGDEGEEAWLNPEYSSCVELTANGEADVIICDFHAA